MQQYGRGLAGNGSQIASAMSLHERARFSCTLEFLTLSNTVNVSNASTYD